MDANAEQSPTLTLFGQELDLPTVLRATGVAALVAAEIAEIEVVVPTLSCFCTVEVGWVVASNPPNDVIDHVAKREFAEATRASLEYGANIGEKLLKNGVFTRVLVEETSLIGRLAVQSGSWLINKRR